jgi:PAS domain S-box-containing protein
MTLSADLPLRYRKAFAAYVDNNAAEEAALIAALDLGRAALAEGRSLLDLLSIHHRLVPAFVAKSPTGADIKRRFAKAEEFLAQVVAPSEMANRGWQDIVTRLRQLNNSLEREIAERTAALRKSEQRFRDITEIGGDWIWESDTDHRFIFFVGQSLETVSIPPESVLGKTWWELAGADLERDERWTRYKSVMDKQQPFRRFHHVVATPADERLYVAASGKPVFDEWGSFLGYRGTATDETVVVEAHHRIEEAEVLLRDAIESIYEGFVIFDKHERLVTCNRAFREMHAECAGLDVSGARISCDIIAIPAARLSVAFVTAVGC